jgi:hypothetical protein
VILYHGSPVVFDIPKLVKKPNERHPPWIMVFANVSRRLLFRTKCILCQLAPSSFGELTNWELRIRIPALKLGLCKSLERVIIIDLSIIENFKLLDTQTRSSITYHEMTTIMSRKLV